jgi:hypothetical protein
VTSYALRPSHAGKIVTVAREENSFRLVIDGEPLFGPEHG